jgi:hypothetical protein
MVQIDPANDGLVFIGFDLLVVLLLDGLTRLPVLVLGLIGENGLISHWPGSTGLNILWVLTGLLGGVLA